MEEEAGSKAPTLQNLLEEMWEVMAHTAKSKGPRFSSVEALVAILILEVRQLKAAVAGLSTGN
jgi:hypothetical protein